MGKPETKERQDGDGKERIIRVTLDLNDSDYASLNNAQRLLGHRTKRATSIAALEQYEEISHIVRRGGEIFMVEDGVRTKVIFLIPGLIPRA
jgi:hypothetical protein